MSLEAAERFVATLPASQRARSIITRWYTALDNYSPTREHAVGLAVSFTLPTTRETGYVLFSADRLPLASESVYVVQTDNTVTAMYAVQWHGNADEFGARVVLHPYPTDNGPLIFGPKRSYHVKLRTR